MALLVSDNGELQSLRYLVNSDRNIPRNLILKLYTSNTVPTETDVPSQTAYYEPYDATGLVGYGTAPSTGYPSIINARHDEDYSRQYGIFLNGSEWNVRTILNPIATTTGSGNINEYTITVSSVSNIAVGHYVSGGNVGTNAVVAAIDAGRGLLSDATYAARSVAEGDPRGVLGAFQRGGQPQSLSAASSDAPPAMKAFHSTPNDFERFDLSKIGTGEGEHTYGHGM